MFWEVDCKIKQNETRQGKNMEISAKIHRNGAKIVQKQAFFRYKTLVLHKKKSKIRRFSLWKCAVSGCVWKHPAWILSVFMHFYEGLLGFWTGFWLLPTFLIVFEPFFDLIWSHTGPFLDYFGTKMGWFWGDFGPFSDHSSVILGSLREHFGVDWTPLWTIFGPFWPIWGHFSVILRSFLWFFAVVLGSSLQN